MIVFEPNALREFIPSEYREVDAPPKFFFKALSAREILTPKDVLDKLIEKGDVKTDEDLMFLVGGIKCALADWDIKGVDYEPDKLADICTTNELFELLGFVASDGLTYQDKKKSESEP